MSGKVFQFLRWFFSILLFTTALGKLLDNRGFAEVIATYKLFEAPEFILLFIALGFSFFELYISYAVFKNLHLKLNGLMLMALHLGYTGLALLTILRGIELSNCGCFGVFLARPLTYQTVFEDLLLFIISLAYYLLARGKN